MGYIVKDIHIKHGTKSGGCKIYAPGDPIELSDTEAAPLMHNLEKTKENKTKKGK